MAVNPRGFVPCRKLGGHVSFATREYQVSANNPTQIFPGDPVYLTSDGNVRRVKTSGVATANGFAVLGIVRGVKNTNRRPLTHSQPTQGPFLPASTAGFVDVIDDPDVTYIVNCDASLLDSNIGSFVSISAGAANTAAGISGISIKLSEATASAVGQRFRIVAASPMEGKFPLEGIADVDAEVMISDHHFRRKYNKVGRDG